MVPMNFMPPVPVQPDALKPVEAGAQSPVIYGNKRLVGNPFRPNTFSGLKSVTTGSSLNLLSRNPIPAWNNIVGVRVNSKLRRCTYGVVYVPMVWVICSGSPSAPLSSAEYALPVLVRCQ